MSLHLSTHTRASARRTRPAAGSSALLALYESAYTATLADFQTATIGQLLRFVGCDGAVWGHGSTGPGGAGVRFDGAEVFGRPGAIVTDYACVGQEDPAARAFFERPEQLQSLAVNDFYRGAKRGRIREYLNEYKVSHLMLGGGRCGPVVRATTVGDAMSWITLYRSEAGKPFATKDAAWFAALLPHCMQAHDICAALASARTAGATRPQSAASPEPRASNRPRNDANASSVCEALSAREREVLSLVARGFNYLETAVFMGLSIATVRSHARHVYGKLGAHNKTEAVFEARLLGWLD